MGTVNITKEQIGSKILAIGYDQCGTTKIAKLHIFTFTSLATGKTDFIIVTREAKRKYMDVQKAVIYGKQGVDFFKVSTIAQLNKLVNKHLV